MLTQSFKWFVEKKKLNKVKLLIQILFCITIFKKYTIIKKDWELKEALDEKEQKLWLQIQKSKGEKKNMKKNNQS